MARRKDENMLVSKVEKKIVLEFEAVTGNVVFKLESKSLATKPKIVEAGVQTLDEMLSGMNVLPNHLENVLDRWGRKFKLKDHLERMEAKPADIEKILAAWRAEGYAGKVKEALKKPGPEVTGKSPAQAAS